MLLLSIPKPCHENWNEMSPREKGAFCNVCAKTVVDFTVLSDEEVKNYFLQNSGQKTCGRFRDDQLAEPRTLHELLSRPIPFWKKFLAITFILFGSFLSGCQDRTIGKIETLKTTTLGEPEPEYTATGIMLTEITSDTIFKEDICTVTVGEITEGIIEPHIIEIDGTMPIMIIEEPKEKSDTVFFTGGIKIDSIKKINPDSTKIDSAKKIVLPNECDTLPLRAIEP